MLKILWSAARQSSRSYARFVKKKSANPGVSQTLGAFRRQDIKLSEEELEDYEELEQAEPDFGNIGRVEREGVHEIISNRHKLRKRIVQQKYFNENYPNLLMWSEKEQIRHLNQSDPNIWTSEKLASCFPATKGIIEKVLAATWKPATETRINRHDASAARNWKELKEGTLEGVNPGLRTHLLKYSGRVIPTRRPEHIRQTVRLSLGEAPEEVGEYAQIIANFQKSIAAPAENVPDKPKLIVGPQPRSKELMPKSQDKQKRLTFEELQLNIKEKMENNESVLDTDKFIANYEPNDVVLNLKNDKNDDTTIREIEKRMGSKTGLTTQLQNPNYLQPVAIAQKIKIPKDVWMKGKTYKVEDCYYDDDGYFLYRVPGMTS